MGTRRTSSGANGPRLRALSATVAGIALAASVLCGCAIGAQQQPQALGSRGATVHHPTDPPPRLTTTSASYAMAPVTIYLEGANERLVAVRRQVAWPATIGSVLVQLSQGPTRRESSLGLASPASSVGPIESRGLGNGVLSVNLPTSFEDLDGNDQTMAAAQIVFSVTTFSDVRGVWFFVGGQKAEVPNGNGRLTAGPSTRQDYTVLSG